MKHRKHSLLQKLINPLNQAMDKAHELLAEDFHYPSRLMATASKQGNKFVFENGWVIQTENEHWFGKKKNFYDVYESRTGQRKAERLSLFMSAIAIVNANANKRADHVNDTQKILSLDTRYLHHLNDAVVFNARLKSNLASEFKRELYLIRMEEAMINCKATKIALRPYI